LLSTAIIISSWLIKLDFVLIVIDVDQKTFPCGGPPNSDGRAHGGRFSPVRMLLPHRIIGQCFNERNVKLETACLSRTAALAISQSRGGALPATGTISTHCVTRA
jgi:hypothetical protein